MFEKSRQKSHKQWKEIKSIKVETGKARIP
jgi:hypothetical protein